MKGMFHLEMSVRLGGYQFSPFWSFLSQLDHEGPGPLVQQGTTSRQARRSRTALTLAK
jgi:hypothetical protein